MVVRRRVLNQHDYGQRSPTIGPSGHHGSEAVAACSVAPCAPTRQCKLHAELRRDALLTPGVVVRGHVRDESLHLNRNAGRPRQRDFTAKETKKIAVPPHERLGPHNRQELAPVNPVREQNECDSGGVVRAARSNLAFDVTRKAVSGGTDSRRPIACGTGTQTQPTQEISEEGRATFEASVAMMR